MKYNTIINNNPQNNSKYKSYINSPTKDDSMSLIKKKFHKLKKFNNNSNKDSHSYISSSYVNIISPINNYKGKKQNSSLAKFLKNKFIQNSNSFDNTSFFRDKVTNNNKMNATASYNFLNENMNKSNTIHLINKSIKAEKPLKYNVQHNHIIICANFEPSTSEGFFNNKLKYLSHINSKKNSKEKNRLNSLSISTVNNKKCNNLSNANMPTIKKMKNSHFNIHKHNNSNQNILNNTLFEYNKNQKEMNNFYENYLHQIKITKNKKLNNPNKNLSIGSFNPFSNISYKKKNNLTNSTKNNNSIYAAFHKVKNNKFSINFQPNKKQITNKNIVTYAQSPVNAKYGTHISKTAKVSSRASTENLNNANKKFVEKPTLNKTKSISIITKNNINLFGFKNSKGASNINTNNKLNSTYNINKPQINIFDVHGYYSKKKLIVQVIIILLQKLF